MKLKRNALLAAVAASATVYGTQSWAAIVNGVGGENTLAELIEYGGVWVGDKYFSDFSLTIAASSGVVAPTPDAITVTNVEVAGNYGLKFNAGWLAFPGQLNNATLGFSVEVGANYPDYYITDAHLYVTAASTQANGVVSISENIFDAAPPLGTEIGDLNYFEQGGEISDLNVDFVDFDPLKKVWVIKDITVADATPSGTQGVGYSHLSEFYQTFSQIPEPGTAALALLGTLAVASRRRRQG